MKSIDNMSTQFNVPQLDCHLADEAELKAACGNAHECWGEGHSFEEYVDWRMQSAQHSRASWYVGCVDDRVVTAMGAYPIVVRAGGHSCPGYGIGGVHTLPKVRRRGYAAKLLHWVLQKQLNAGTQFGLLYSDIKPKYYTEMGYRLCESYYAWAFPRCGTEQAKGTWIESFEPGESVGALAKMYESVQSTRTIWIERDDVYWGWVCRRYPEHEWCWWVPADSEDPAGYLQLRRTKTETRVFDWGVLPGSNELSFWKSVLAWAAARGISRIDGWLPPSKAISQCFKVTPRIKELTMISPLTPEAPWDDSYMQDTAWFTECDHI